jgi:glycogen operon protein
MRQMKNMLTVLFTSRGIPMILSGDEFANTQYGNNNAYCQDNEISWLDWNQLETYRDMFDYVRRLIAFRKAHPVLRAESYDFSHNGTGYPELSFHGEEPWQLDEKAPALVFAYMYAEDHRKAGTDSDCFIYIAVNAHWEEHCMKLPIIPAGCFWKLAFDSAGFSAQPGEEKPYESFESVTLGPRSVKVLIGTYVRQQGR